MIVVESDCDCDFLCEHPKTIKFVCDCCDDEVNDLYYFEGQELCIDCVETKLERVEYYG